MGTYTASNKHGPTAVGGDQSSFNNNLFLAQQNTLTQAGQQSPIPQGQKMGGLVASNGAPMLNNTHNQAETNRKVRRSVNVVQSKFAQNSVHQQMHQPPNLFNGQVITDATALGRNMAVMNVNNKYMNHSLNFADQQSAGSDLNYDAAIAQENNIFQQTQQVVKPPKRTNKKNQA